MKNEGENIVPTSFDSERRFATNDAAPGVGVCIEFLLARATLRRSFHVPENSIEAERNRLLEELTRYKMVNKQFKNDF